MIQAASKVLPPCATLRFELESSVTVGRRYSANEWLQQNCGPTGAYLERGLLISGDGGVSYAEPSCGRNVLPFFAINVHKAPPAGGRSRSERRTTNHCRTIGKPSTFKIASRPAATSDAIVCAEIKERPRPAITACLIVSFDPISILSLGCRMPASLNRYSNMLLVPVPSSRTRDFWLANSALATRRRRLKGWSAEAMITWGFGPNASLSTPKSPGGRPIKAMSMS